jgi:hypothetical protein
LRIFRKAKTHKKRCERQRELGRLISSWTDSSKVTITLAWPEILLSKDPKTPLSGVVKILLSAWTHTRPG